MCELQQFTANNEGRDFVIGDLHGQLELLYRRLNEVSFNYEVDRLFSTGDLIDRGPDSVECALLAEQNWFHPVLGNHEDDYRSHLFEANTWERLNQEWGTLNQQISAQMLIKLHSIIEKMPMTIEVELLDGRHVGITHASPPCDDWLDVGKALQTQQGRLRCLFDRRIHYPGQAPVTRNIDLTVHGHNVVAAPFSHGNAALIDCGAGQIEPGARIGYQQGYADLVILQLEDLFSLPSINSPQPVPSQSGVCNAAT
ncbi:MAG: metallophosphoesterase [Motiliproteus sp.]